MTSYKTQQPFIIFYSLFQTVVSPPLDIYKWFPYNSYINKERTSLQRDNLVSTGLYNINDVNDIKMIPTKLIKMYNDDIMEIQDKIRIEDTEEVLENEVFYSSQMEGANTTLIRARELKECAKINDDNRNSELMVLNGFKAAEYLNVIGNKISKESIIQVWNILVEGCCGNESVRGAGYRIGPVCVGNHNGLDCDLIDSYMDGLIKFYTGSKYDEVPFIKAALLHYMFETIHPFCDGNGRLGRLLINNYLISRGYDCCRAVSFSKMISEQRGGYDAAFYDSENLYNDCTPFMKYMLGIFDDSLHLVLESQSM